MARNKCVEIKPYLYTSSGVKVEKIVTNGSNITKTNYVDGFQYEGEDLKFFPHAEGYVNNGDNGFEYIYNYTDHLGNVRLSYKDNNGSLEVLEENNYYPLGLKHSKYNQLLQIMTKRNKQMIRKKVGTR